MLRNIALLNTGLISRVLLSTNILALCVQTLAGLNLLVFCVPLARELGHPDTAASTTQQIKRVPAALFVFSETAPFVLSEMQVQVWCRLPNQVNERVP
jgi:hypothetical protein